MNLTAPIADNRPLVIDLFCGLGGWSEAFIAEGYRPVGFDIEAHDYGSGGYPGELVLRDIRSLTGAELVKQYGVPAVIVCSPPCQEFSYMAMPWSKAKEKRRKILSDQAERVRLTDLFNQCFRIQREVSEAAGHYVPMVVENVRGAQEWVGKARWNYGSYYLWGDVPALMPITISRRKTKVGSWDMTRVNYNPNHEWSGVKAGDRNKAAGEGGHKWSASFAETIGTKMGPSPGKMWCDRPPSVAAHREQTGFKSQGMNWSDRSKHGQCFTRIAASQSGVKQGGDWFNQSSGNSISRRTGSKSKSRKAASALIAKIPAPLAQWIARVYKPATVESLNLKVV